LREEWAATTPYAVGALLVVAVMRWMRAKPVPDTTDTMPPPNPSC